ncbi:MAG: replication restart helicase PriA [Culicoidibacterales bacterium]
MIAAVIVDIKAYAVDKIFDYMIPEATNITIGMKVKVPFGPRIIEGYVIELKKEPEDQTVKLKAIISVSDIQFLNEELIKLAITFAQATGSFKTSFLQAMLPKNITKRKTKMIEEVMEIDKSKVSPKATKQQEIISFLSQENLPQQLKMLRDKFGTSIIQAMKKNGAIITKMQSVEQLPSIPTVVSKSNVVLREEQNAVLSTLKQNCEQPYLLQGVTGSGKTEIYIQLIAHVIESGKTALLLVPEIGLTPQMIGRFEQRFSVAKIAVLHSGLTPAKRYDMWLKIKQKRVDIVLGTRSAIFAPLENIGVIIVDEEHDASYRQENAPSYNALEIAAWRAKRHKATLLLASATPSLESYVRAKKKIYKPLYLKQRISEEPTNVEVIDMRQSVGEIEYRYFSKELLAAIKQALAKKQQVMLLLNRRGYAPVTVCTQCGHTPNCPNCDTTLTFHKNKNKLICHYCQHTQDAWKTCPKCDSRIMMQGVGIQKIVEELERILPDARLLRVDKDSIKNYDDYHNFYASFLAGEADIMVGTQMITKGFDFPNVTVVGVLETDQILHMPDLRAREKTYQLLRQVIGRAGRGNHGGTAFLQTFDAKNSLFTDIIKEQYDQFANKELLLRKQFQNPPYCHISDIIVSSEFQHEATRCVQYMYDQLQKLSSHATIYPPSSTFIARINNRYYYHILIKYKDSSKIIGNVSMLLTHVVKHFPKVHSYIQVNPINFL